ncbi:MAG TPA: class I fructose-bisphosphate aldolase [Candidatus Limnocylindria bacterium]|nr:class I fructose-bisphosphate aldolase [Candidatus Limnocylindria bacterium]
MSDSDLARVAEAMVAPGRGILAADESSNTIQRRFEKIGVESTPDTRRDYRELLFRTADAMSKYISGVILYDETIRQNAKDGTPLVKLIEQAGSIPGIKVDTGTSALPFRPGEVVTVGLDALRDRLTEYRDLGARFAKWRAVIAIGQNMPSRTCIVANAHALARYAALCQEAGIVPIVEPEVLIEGDHDIDRCAEVTEFALKTVYAELYEADVWLEGTVLKPNMVTPGDRCPTRAAPEEIAARTVQVLKACVPSAVPGIAFLSGGQSDGEATANLDAINRVGGTPWRLTFSYGRALQAAPQKAWSGKAENVAAAQRAFQHRAEMNALAARGHWKAELERSRTTVAV